MEAEGRKLIVSASRRQDMPACQTERLLSQIVAREFTWRQPYSGKALQLRFEAEEIFCLALWSKDFGPLLTEQAAAIIEPLRPYFLFTVNDCPALERGLRTSLPDRLAQASAITRRYGAGRMLWRFDPIVHFRVAAGPRQHNLHSFERIAAHMAKLGVRRCVFSFAQLYGKVLKRERRLQLEFIDPPLEDKLSIIARLADFAAELGIEMHGCCQPELVASHPNVQAARCIDGPYLASVIDADSSGLDLAPHPSRKGCGCTRSIDIGNYEACAHRCAYCYANPNLD